MKRIFPKIFSTCFLSGPNARRVLDCGDKRNVPPLLNGYNSSAGARLIVCKSGVMATALQDAGAPVQAPFGSRTWLFVLLPVSILLAGCGAKPESTQGEASGLPTASVQVLTIENQPYTSTEAIVGTVQAKLHATLEAKVSGHIEQMPVRLGQPVKAGELVALLNSSDLQARLDQAEASREQAERNWDRISALFHQQAATHAEFDDAQAQKRVADAAVAEAKAMLAYAKIVAPFDGVVTRKWTDVGDFAAPGKPLLDIEDPSKLQVQADVPDVIASHVRDGEDLAVHVDALNEELTGTIAEISPAGDPITHTFRVKVDLPATPGLMSGQFARLEVPIGKSQALLVPDSAVVERGELEILFVVVSGHAQLCLVKTGRHAGDQMEILSGLDAGDIVVIHGASQLTDGQPVEAR
ncbi:MAG: efflux RND transporter periplasmic adaptor subunit [Verrucomicrobiia bacterium]